MPLLPTGKNEQYMIKLYTYKLPNSEFVYFYGSYIRSKIVK